jgi:hypothetical protein
VCNAALCGKLTSGDGEGAVGMEMEMGDFNDKKSYWCCCVSPLGTLFCIRAPAWHLVLPVPQLLNLGIFFLKQLSVKMGRNGI